MKVNIVFSVSPATSTGLNTHEAAFCHLKLNFDAKKEYRSLNH